MPDASPTKWHLAHTTWFFEALALLPHVAGYQPFDCQYAYLFNSYYEALGPRHPRLQRGLLSRPSIDEVHAYRNHVDQSILALSLTNNNQVAIDFEALLGPMELGLHHEQQHQELLLTDILHLFSCNPLLPAYNPSAQLSPQEQTPVQWLALPGGIVRIGHAGPNPKHAAPEQTGFAFDNETPRHQRLLPTSVFLKPRLTQSGRVRACGPSSSGRQPLAPPVCSRC